MSIDRIGGRKNVLGYLFLLCCSGLAAQMQAGTHDPDYVGLATVIGAMAGGVGALVWGNVQEHKSKDVKEKGGPGGSPN